jgi:hypothetical protein
MMIRLPVYLLVRNIAGDGDGRSNSGGKHCPVHVVCYAGMVIKLQHVFLQTAVLYVLQQSFKIFLDLVIAQHIFYGLVVVNMVVILFGLARTGFCYDPATPTG